MAHDEKLVLRVRQALAAETGVSERRMFGGICFMVDDKMALGCATPELMVRVGKERYAEALAQAHVRPMDFTGKPFVGYVYVAPAGLRTAAQLARWTRAAVDFVRTLPPPRRRAKPKPFAARKLAAKARPVKARPTR
jgi:TfoX/Sxy family transcriptional regulator of competence genes